jgi:ElaB/YqjD/DUF883 family membrane-anchored ribosome-binding protein
MKAKAMVSKITHNAAPVEELMDELRLIVADAEELLQVTANQTGEVAATARARIEKSLHVVKERLVETESAVIERTRQATKVTDQFVHENPWQSIGICACAGVVIGMLIARR